MAWVWLFLSFPTWAVCLWASLIKGWEAQRVSCQWHSLLRTYPLHGRERFKDSSYNILLPLWDQYIEKKTEGKALRCLKACWPCATSVPGSRSQGLSVPCHTPLQRHYQEAKGKWQWKKHESKGQLLLKARASCPDMELLLFFSELKTPTGKMELSQMCGRDSRAEEHKKKVDCY